MELIDGYQNKELQLDIVDRNTMESIGAMGKLHDKCVEFLKCTSI